MRVERRVKYELLWNEKSEERIKMLQGMSIKYAVNQEFRMFIGKKAKSIG